MRPFSAVSWRVRDRVLSNADHTLIMGVLNVTPDSFSDGGRWADPEPAIRHGLAMLEAGADLIDVGGESTRPGSRGVGSDEEQARVIPVVAALAEAGGVVSIDTSKPAVAAAALDAGAAVVNDVTALGEPGMAAVVAGGGAGVVLMHMQGTPRTMQVDPHYDDVVAEVRGFLLDRIGIAWAAGIATDRICIDPGIGFGKTGRHNLTLLRNVADLAGTGHPVLVGASRKSFLTSLLGDLPAEERDVPTVGAHVLAICGGAAVIRVHDVTTALRSARVADAIVRVEEVTADP